MGKDDSWPSLAKQGTTGGTSDAPRVSVLMTVYNGAATIESAVRSVIAQEYADWELVVVDDGSTDWSADIVEAVAVENSRIVVYRPGRLGRGNALNFGLARCRGEYIAILDADDLALPQRLSRQVDLLDRRPEVGLVATWAEVRDEDGRLLAKQRLPYDGRTLRRLLARDYPFTHSSVTYRKSVLQMVGGFNETLQCCVDYDVAVRIAAISEIACVQEVSCIRVLSANRYYRKIPANTYLVTSTRIRLRALRQSRETWLVSPWYLLRPVLVTCYKAVRQKLH